MCLKNVSDEWNLNYCYIVQFESIPVSFIWYEIIHYAFMQT